MAAIQDWRDPDSLRREDGAEDRDYLAGGAGHGAADRPFRHPAELLQVRGMTPAVFAHELVHVTQYRRLGVTGFLLSYFGMSALTVLRRAIQRKFPIRWLRIRMSRRLARAAGSSGARLSRISGSTTRELTVAEGIAFRRRRNWPL